MKLRWVSVILALALVAAVFVVLPPRRGVGGDDVLLAGQRGSRPDSSWNSNRGGGGSTPANFTGGDVFVIQNGHNMTTSANWAVSGTGAKVQIKNGGSLGWKCSIGPWFSQD